MGDHLSAYHDALAFLFARTTGKSKFGLERTEAFLRVLGDPHRRVRAFHVAGTNGKGSVCASIEALLRARALRVGKYTSPHLVDFRERIVTDGVAVSEDWVVEFIRRWTPTVESIGATFFEATTAMAFAWFAEAGADVTVVETGLGGRLDSTNVVRPVVAGVTSIGIDHVEYLGDTLEAIAAEKAGIFKPGAPAASGEPAPEVDALLRRLAHERGASRVASVWRDAPPRDVEVSAGGTSFTLDLDGVPCRFRTPLLGEHQASNAALALLMVREAGAPFWGGPAEGASALAQVRLPGRFQRVGRYIFDVEHNPDGARVFAQTVARVTPPAPVVALLCVLADKDWRGIMEALAPVVSRFFLTEAPTAPASRAWSLPAAAEYARSRGWPATALRNFDESLASAGAEGETVLITGSFHTVGDAMSRLQVDPLAG